MSDSLGQTIDAAVDRAAGVTADPGQDPTATPASKTPAPSPSPARHPGDSAARSGSDRATSAEPEPGGSTTQTTDADAQVLTDQGWLDLEQRRTILNNARKKAAAGVFAELGVPDATDDERAEVAEYVRLLVSDPARLHATLGQVLRDRGLLTDTPTQTPTTPTQRADTTPQQARATKLGEGFTFPEPRFRTEAGEGVYADADIQSLVTSIFDHVSQVMDARLEPHDTVISDMALEKLRSEVSRAASSEFAEAQAWPRFNDCAPRIRQLISAARARKDTSVTLRSAYDRARVELEDSEAPTRESKIRDKVLADINKAKPDVVRTAPHSPVSRTGTRRPHSVSEAFDQAVDDAVSRLT